MAMPENDPPGEVRRENLRREKQHRKLPRKATARHLENAGLHYLQRFASSAENFRRVMLRKVEQSARAHDTDREEGAAHVEALVARFLRAGLLDDAVYARGRALAQFRRGRSPRAIRAALRAKGLGDDDIAEALAALAEEAAEPELAAALTLARRRRLGPFRAPGGRAPAGRAPAGRASAGRASDGLGEEERSRRRAKDLAALARAGFGYDVARTVIDASSVAALEERLAEGGL